MDASSSADGAVVDFAAHQHGGFSSEDDHLNYWGLFRRGGAVGMRRSFPYRRLLRSLLKGNKRSADQSSIVVRAVQAPNSTVLPAAIIAEAAARAGLMNGNLNSTTATNTARLLKGYYDQNGYVLCSVNSATITPDGVVSLSVVEPRVGKTPVGMRFLKEMVVNPETNTTMTFKKFKEMQVRRKVVKKLRREDLNTTYIDTTGRTRGEILAKSLKLKEGEVFRWDNSRWQSIAKSGLFNLVRTRPTMDESGDVQLVVVAEEKPNRNLEYGVTKSLYTGEWEGEMTFEHSNLMGGNECGR